jgi:hypothetical protein
MNNILKSIGTFSMWIDDFELFFTAMLRILTAHILLASGKPLINWANQFRKPLHETSRIKHLQNATFDNENTVEDCI